MLKTLNYIILSSIFFFFGTQISTAQTIDNDENNEAEKKPMEIEKKTTEKKDSIKIWQGILIETDLIPIVQKTILNSDGYSFQGTIQLNLNRKYYPTIEGGIGSANKTATNGIQFKSTGVFGKLGLDIPIFTPKLNSSQKNNVFLAGVRLGVSRLNYSLYNLILTDEYWGGSETVHLEGIGANKFWFEINAGIRVEVFKNIYMGWTVKNKRLLNKAKPGEIAPWYIPGYGIGNDSGWGFNYTLGYRIK